MAESPRSIQAAALEIPVTIQGSKPVDSAAGRELFVESTNTTLVFDNGAVVSLKSKLLPGQCVFLRNERTGKEILCKVLEWREQGESRYADLEFTSYEPEFWGHLTNEPVAGDARSEAQKRVDEAVADLTAKAANEKSCATPPASGETAASEPAISTAATEAVSAGGLPEASKGSPKTADETSAHECEKEAGAAPAGEAADQAKDAAKDAAKQEAPVAVEAAPTGAQEAAGGESQEALKKDEAVADDEGEVTVPRKRARKAKPVRPPNFKARKMAAAISVAVAIAVISFQVYEWHARFKHGAPVGHRTSSTAAIRSNQPEPVAATATRADEEAAAVRPVALASMKERTLQPAAKQEDRAAIAKSTPTASADIRDARRDRMDEGSAAREKEARGSTVSAATGAGIRAGHPHASTANAGETVPAKIVSQAQPPFPGWAKGLDIGTVVQLDAVIDAQGNLAATTPLSGPHILQHAAERAVALWIFEPAMQDGKPVASHMVLTVQFQR